MMLPKRLDFKMTEQLIRSLVMMSLLHGNHYTRVQKYIEAIHFIREAIRLWFDTLYEIYRIKAYQALSLEERQGTVDRPGIELGSFSPNRPNYLRVPEDPILLIDWVSQLTIPNADFNELMKIAQSKSKTMHDVPSPTTLPLLQLSVYYLMTLADSLRQVGLCKYSLLVYAFIRLIIIYLQPNKPIDGYQALLSSIHFKCIQVLVEMGLHDESINLSSNLPPDDDGRVSTVGEYLGKVSTYLSIYLPTYLLTYFSTYISFIYIYPPTYLPILTYLSTFLSVYLCTHLPTYLSSYHYLCYVT